MTEKRLIVDMDYNIIDTATGYGLDENDMFELVNELAEENKNLKVQLFKGGDVCDICKHQYLTKNSIDGYYTAKCKKGYGECSKGTVRYCEAFECKELEE